MVVESAGNYRANARAPRSLGIANLLPGEDPDEQEDEELDWDDDPLDPLAEVGEPLEWDEEETQPEWGDFWPELDDGDT